MSVGSRDDLTQFDPGVFPALRFIAITKSIRRARAVKYYQLPKVLLAIQDVAQCRTQRRDARAHRNQNQIVAVMAIQIETVTGHAEEIESRAFLHIKDFDAGAGGSLDQYFQFVVFGRTGESKVSRLFITDAQHRNLTRNESHPVRWPRAHRQQIKRTSVGPLIAHASDDEVASFGLLHPVRL